MRSNTPQTLNPVERNVWNLYKQQRLEELRQINPGRTESEFESTAWFEFLHTKWSLKGATDDNAVTLFDNALRQRDYGPDLRSIPRNLVNLSKKIKIKKPKNHTIKSHLRGARDGHKPGITHNSSYTFYVHKRANELKQKGIPFCVKSTISQIAKEWAQLSDEKRMEIDEEWLLYCQGLKEQEQALPVDNEVDLETDKSAITDQNE